MENEIEEKILSLLEKNPEGLTIVEIARRIGKERHTASKYIHGLVKADKIFQRRVGVVSLCYLKGRFVEAVKEKGLRR